MNKKGFTLVELLAVIAILGFLVLVIVPNVIDVFKGSKKNNFLSEAQAVYKSANNTYVLDRARGTLEITYQNGMETTPSGVVKKLDLSNRDGFAYQVKINSSGEIVLFIAKDLDFKIELDGSENPILLKDINTDKIEENN